MSGAVIWFTDLSGTGKSTVAEAFGVEARRELSRGKRDVAEVGPLAR